MEGKQLGLFVLALVSLIVTTLVVVLRCAVRASIRGFGIDDWAMAIGQVLFFGSCCGIMWGCQQGIGVRDVHLTAENLVNARHSIVIFQCFYLMSLVFIKGSICFALLRITTSKVIKNLLYFIIFISFCGGFITTVAVMSLCMPLSAAWTGHGKCASPQVLVGVAYFVTVTSIITDFACSILPFVILWGLQMNRRLKLTLAAVLGLGFLASAATVIRAFYFNRFLAQVDYVWGFCDLMAWSTVEDLIAVVVGSIPSLKPLFSRMKWLGIDSSTRTHSRTNGTSNMAKGGSRHGGYRLDSMKSSQEKNGVSSTVVQREEDESESVKDMLEDDRPGIFVSSEYNVEHEQEGNPLPSRRF